MLFLPLAPPAQVAQAPDAPATLDHLQELLEAIPEALIQGKAGTMKGLVAKAWAGWEQGKAQLQKTLPEPDLAATTMQLKAMQKMKPREQAVGALGISATLSRFQPRSRKQDLLQADRVAMAAWCGVDGAMWEPMPNVEGAFKILVDQDKGQHTLAVVGIQEALKRFQESRSKRQAPGAKKALKELLNLLDVLEKP